MDCSTIMAVLLDKRTDAAPRVQKILTDYGCIISSRIGLHQVNDCSEDGLIILHLCGEEKEVEELESKLEKVNRVNVKKMKVSFDD